MQYPQEFRRIFTDKIFKLWVSLGQPAIVTIILDEVPDIFYEPPGPMPEETVVYVTNIRCWNRHGVLEYEPVNTLDLTTVEDWLTRKHTKEKADGNL